MVNVKSIGEKTKSYVEGHMGGLMVTGLSALMMIENCYAEEGGITEGSGVTITSNILKSLTTALNTFYMDFRGFATLIAILCILFCGIVIMFGHNPKNAQLAKSWALCVVIGLAIVWLIVPLISYVLNILSNAGASTDLNDLIK